MAYSRVGGWEQKKLLTFLTYSTSLAVVQVYQFDPSLFSFEFNSVSIYWVLAVCDTDHFKKRDFAAFTIISTSLPTPEAPQISLQPECVYQGCCVNITLRWALRNLSLDFPKFLSFLFSSSCHIKFSRISDSSRWKELGLTHFHLLTYVFCFLPWPESHDVLAPLLFLTSWV